MVKHVHITLDKAAYDDLDAIKERHGLTWAELLEQGAHTLDAERQ